MRLAELSSHNAAAGNARKFALAAGLATTLAMVATAVSRSHDAMAAMTMALGASFGIAVAGYGAAAAMMMARASALRAEQLGEALPGEDAGRAIGDGLRRHAGAQAGWRQAAVGGLIASTAFVAAGFALGDGGVWNRSDATAATLAAGFFAGAFALLVVERHLESQDAADLPEAPALAALTRVPIAVSMTCGLGCVLLYAGIGAGAYAGRLSAVLCLTVSAEMLVRALATLFMPFPPMADARMTTISAVAGAIALRRPRPVATAVRDPFGIDLSRSWALAFVRSAALPVAVVLMAFVGALSGVEALHVDQRAIYERFGKPVAVLGPGLHAHLPWPIGRLRAVELGVMHDVPIVFDTASSGQPSRLSPIASDA